MTPDDFVRSLSYGARQPEGLGLDSYNKFDPKVNLTKTRVFNRTFFIWFKLLGAKFEARFMRGQRVQAAQSQRIDLILGLYISSHNALK